MTNSADELDDFFQSDLDSVDAQSDADTDQDIPVPPRLGLLKDLDSASFSAVARAAKLKHHVSGDVICRQGASPDRFFILVDGSCEVVRDSTVIATLDPGAFFGESAMLMGVNRTASVVATTAASIWSVDAQSFETILGPHLMSNAKAAAEAKKRISSTPRSHS